MSILGSEGSLQEDLVVLLNNPARSKDRKLFCLWHQWSDSVNALAKMTGKPNLYTDSEF